MVLLPSLLPSSSDFITLRPSAKKINAARTSTCYEGNLYEVVTRSRELLNMYKYSMHVYRQQRKKCKKKELYENKEKG